MGRNHLRTILDNKDFTLSCVCDPNINELCRSINIPSHIPLISNLSEIPWDDFECAIIATPTTTHVEVAGLVLEHKKHVLLEKPIAPSEQQSKTLNKLAIEKEVLLCVGHVERSNPAVRKLQEVIDLGWIGKPIHISATRVGGYPMNVEPGNNVLLDLAVHDLDVLSLILGDLQICGSICHSSWQSDVYDTAQILLTNSLGVSSSIHVNWITPTKIRTLRVTGTRGVCFVDYIKQSCVVFGGNLSKVKRENQFDFKLLQMAYNNSDQVQFGVHKEEPLKIQLHEYSLALAGKNHRLASATQAGKMVKLAQDAIDKSTRGLRFVSQESCK